MFHYASPLLKVSFDGPDLRDETLYNLLRVSGGMLPKPCTRFATGLTFL